MSKLKTLTRRAALCVTFIGVGVHIAHEVATQGPAPTLPSQAALATDATGGLLKVSASLNGAAPMNFTLDSGASYITVPSTVFDKMLADHTIASTDFQATQPFTLANGTTTNDRIYMLRSVTIAGHTLNNVPLDVGDKNSMMLIGQGVLSRFSSWTVDNIHRTLTVA
jgi:aspartyl protease family protein